MYTVSVILAAYNGEKYITEQIKSLIEQTYPIKIFLYDDKSSDSTNDILMQYNGYNVNGTEIYVVDGSGVQNRGYPDGFLYALSQCPKSDYYAFCDQDDFWHDCKIERGVCCLEQHNQDIPLLYYSAVNYCDPFLQIKRKSIFTATHEGLDVKVDPYKLIYGGGAFGMTMLFNHSLRILIEQATKTYHWRTKDELVKKIAAILGEVYYTESPLVDYRRHSEAVTVKSNTGSKFSKYTSVLVHDSKNHAKLKRDCEIMTWIAENHSNAIFDLKMKLLVDSFVSGSKCKRAFLPVRFRFSLMEEIGLRFLILLGYR